MSLWQLLAAESDVAFALVESGMQGLDLTRGQTQMAGNAGTQPRPAVLITRAHCPEQQCSLAKRRNNSFETVCRPCNACPCCLQ